jgi:hypothetical protein
MYVFADRNKRTYVVLNSILVAVKAIVVLVVLLARTTKKTKTLLHFSLLYPIVNVKLISYIVSFVLLFDI